MYFINMLSAQLFTLCLFFMQNFNNQLNKLTCLLVMNYDFAYKVKGE